MIAAAAGAAAWTRTESATAPMPPALLAAAHDLRQQDFPYLDAATSPSTSPRMCKAAVSCAGS